MSAFNRTWRQILCQEMNQLNKKTRRYMHALKAIPKFDLTDEEKSICYIVQKFVTEEISLKTAEYTQSENYPWTIVKKAHELGFMNATIPEKYGGVHHSMVSNALIWQHLHYGSTSISDAIVANTLAAEPLILYGTDAQNNKYLGRMTDQALVAGYCVTEPAAGSDVLGVKTRAEKKGDEWVLNGQKMWITNSGVANWFFVLARSDPDPKAPAGKAFTGFIVDADTPGITLGRKEWNMGQRASDTRGITFEDVRVPSENVVSSVGNGFNVIEASSDRTRPMIAAGAVGLALRVIDEASEYALKRMAFDQAVSLKRNVPFLLAEMAIEIEMAHWICMKAAYDTGNGLLSSYYPSIAKEHAIDIVKKSIANSMQIFDGSSIDHSVNQLLHDAKRLSGLDMSVYNVSNVLLSSEEYVKNNASAHRCFAMS